MYHTVLKLKLVKSPSILLLVYLNVPYGIETPLITVNTFPAS